MTLDQFIETNSIQKIDLIKLDVDGFELKVLRGGQKTLQKFKPLILFELCPYVLREHGTSAEEMLGSFKK